MKIKWGVVASGVLLMLLSFLIADPAFADMAGNTSQAVKGLADPVSAVSKVADSSFGIFNQFAMMVGGVLLSYGILSSIMQTAHDGEMLGRRFSSLWVPIRVALGCAAIVPVSGGYCGIQIVVQQLVSGASFPAALVNKALNTIDGEAASTSVDVFDASGMRDIARVFLDQQVCKLTYDKQRATVNNAGGGLEMPEMVLLSAKKNEYSMGIPGAPEMCGTYILPDTTNDTDGMASAKSAAITVLQGKMTDLAKKVDDNENPMTNAEVNAALDGAVWQYQADMKTAVQSAVMSNKLLAQQQQMQNEGSTWFMAGFGSPLMTSNGGAIRAAAEPPKGRGPNMTGVSPDVAQGVQSSLGKTAVQASSPSSNDSWLSQKWANFKKSVSETVDMVVDPDILDKAVTNTFQSYITAIRNIGSGDGDPLQNVQTLGYASMSAAAVGMVAAVGIGILSTTAAGIIEKISFALLGFGAMNAFYLPVVPAILYFGAVVGYFFLYFEVMVFAPIWAVRHLLFEGDGVGQGASGYGILLDLLCRPMLISMGYVIGTKILTPLLVKLWTTMFFGVVAAIFDATGIGGFLTSMAMYVIFVLTLIPLLHRCSSFVYILPEKVSRWIGSMGDSHSSSQAEQMSSHSMSGAQGFILGTAAMSAGGGRSGSSGGSKGGPSGPGGSDKPKGDGNIVDIVPRTGGDSAMPDKAPFLGSVEKSKTYVGSGGDMNMGGSKSGSSSSGASGGGMDMPTDKAAPSELDPMSAGVSQGGDNGGSGGSQVMGEATASMSEGAAAAGEAAGAVATEGVGLAAEGAAAAAEGTAATAAKVVAL